jgi:hypothetical protein
MLIKEDDEERKISATSKEVKNLPGANDVIAYASVASLHF